MSVTLAPLPPSTQYSPELPLTHSVFSVLRVLRPRRAAEKRGLSHGNAQNSQRDRVQPLRQTRAGASLPSPAVPAPRLESRGVARSKYSRDVGTCQVFRSTPLLSSQMSRGEAFKHGDKPGSFPKGLPSEGKPFVPPGVGGRLPFKQSLRLCP